MEIQEKKGLRKDFGDLTQLTESIRKVGIINPITISKDGVVVAGRRRLRAWRILHKKYPKTFKPFPPFIRHPLTYKELINNSKMNMFNMIQVHENTQRKEFTPEEISQIKQDIQKEREAGKFPDAIGKETRDIVAELTGVSNRQVDKIDLVVQSAKKTALGKKTLAKLNKGQISVDTAYQIVTRDERNLPKIDPPKGEYDRIYADIPIAFDDEGVRGSAEHHYPTEPKEYFLNVEIPAAKDCVIFFWIPNAFLIDGTAAQILDSWGFYPKAIFTWKKDRIGTGSWSRNQTEHLIMGVKGTMPLPAKLYPTIFEAPRGDHSRKPDEYVMKMMDGMYPKRKSIILWHRGEAPKGWDVHGNEIIIANFEKDGIVSTKSVAKDMPLVVTVDGDKEIITSLNESPIEKMRKKK